jgi:hypothetical protein
LGRMKPGQGEIGVGGMGSLESECHVLTWWLADQTWWGWPEEFVKKNRPNCSPDRLSSRLCAAFAVEKAFQFLKKSAHSKQLPNGRKFPRIWSPWSGVLGTVWRKNLFFCGKKIVPADL